MKTVFDIPHKFFVSDEMRKALSATPLVIADVGSAMGLSANWQPVSEFLEVISFEPDGRSDGDGTVFRTALGDTVSKNRTLYLTELPAASSFYRHHPEMDRFVVRDWLKPAGSTTVEVDTLDSCLNGQPLDFLKVDTEGADLEVLRGATQALETVLAIQVEVSFAQRHEEAPGFSEIDLFLKSCGFRLHSIAHEHWLRDNAAFGANVQPQLIWGDAIYLREDIAETDLAKWALILQAFGFQDFAIDKMPNEWHETMQRSIRSHWAFFLMTGWRWILATLCLPVFWGKAWRKWKLLAAVIFGELHRLTKRTGPKGGIFSDE